MDNKLHLKPRIVFTIVGLSILAVLMFVLRDATRVQLVSSIGVIKANVIGYVYVSVGILSTGIALFVLGVSSRDLLRLHNTAKQAEREAKQKADQAAFEAKQWNTLPNHEETNPDVLEPMLLRIAERYPDTRKGLEVTLKQLATIRQSLAKINDIFSANAGMMSHDKRFENNQILVEKVLEEICPGLIRIIYQAHEHDGVDTFVPKLVEVIHEVNAAYQPHVNDTRDLADGVVEASTEGNTESILAQVQEATNKLNSTPEGWL